ncbi:NAD(P)H-hydrate dehydratase [Pseudorhodoplanes sinuspersici]|uniref:Bifunctional NAD(P)H-hydrate repair enzyme n=1 Tax=Pseudorhodoplanes sinuspersici TaxID=1235591 RepID=A0A1W6ZW39_9HYPH|nr:NAD(P)H-hydrate dehydratase [Pseudorhodoplanes sinuspersici]ARQ01594.1 bifunctional ADP-dependent NAD(P)H-hydrate dehydratase/NAD(P)H-hydrate epimerase [Pseudorhodoplanes sinuspersici]RKE73305.1 hydroxyethylthiazole kinase-like uncharacterized protein yjeF/hydroxyethylthiazole kinase-like uncharacterized protein yjeF [Pseudorhodoplanes sinuspersici]
MHELLTTKEMAEADRLAVLRGTPSIELMENAGRAVADAVGANFGTIRPVIVIAGPGNNGGDGFVAARLLGERGYSVDLRLLGDISKLRGGAATAAKRYSGPVGPMIAEIPPGAIVVDALFGAGLTRNVDGEAAVAVSAINNSGAHVVAVDLPSGINGDTGAVQGTAIRAAETVTFFRKKPGHVLLPGRIFCGMTTIADIGIPSSVLQDIRPRLALNQPSRWAHLFPVPRVEGHKYSRGHTLVVSGGLSSTGAARLSARGALRAGAGLVTIASPRDALAVNAASNLAVMVREAEGAEGLLSLLSDRRINTVILGPGGGIGPQMRATVMAAVRQDRTMILDADALTSFGEKPNELFTELKNHPESTAILTPHEGEFSRIFSRMSKIPSVKQKLEATQAASHETGSVILLKGADSIIFSPDGRGVISENAPPYLATAGAGDVLAGIIAGLCAQGMPAFEATAAGVWLHGEAASEVGPGLIAEDLPEALRPVYRRLYAELGAVLS